MTTLYSGTNQPQIHFSYSGTNPDAKLNLNRGFDWLRHRSRMNAYHYFYLVLEQDPSCAEAYIGQLMSKAVVYDWNMWVEKQKCTYQKCTSEALIASLAATDHIEEMVDEWVLENYLDAETIRNLYAFDLSYNSSLSCRIQQKEKQLDEFSANRYLSNARKYATGPTREVLESGIAEIIAVLDHRIEEARLQDLVNIHALEKSYALHLTTVDKTVQHMGQQACMQQAQDYHSLVEHKRYAKTISEYEQLAANFGKLGNYKDSQALALFCTQKADRLQNWAIFWKTMKVTGACVVLLACCFSYLSNRYERIVAERQAHSNYSSKPRYTTTSTKSNTSAHTSGKPTPEKIGQMQRAAGYYYSDYDYMDAIDDYDNPEDYADDYEDYFGDWDAAYDYWEDHN